VQLVRNSGLQPSKVKLIASVFGNMQLIELMYLRAQFLYCFRLGPVTSFNMDLGKYSKSQSTANRTCRQFKNDSNASLTPTLPSLINLVFYNCLTSGGKQIRPLLYRPLAASLR